MVCFGFVGFPGLGGVCEFLMFCVALLIKLGPLVLRISLGLDNPEFLAFYS